MKKIIAIVAALVVVLGVFAACGGNNEDPSAGNDNTMDAVTVIAGAYDKFAENLAAKDESLTAEDAKAMFIGGYYDENDETTMVQGGAGKLPTDNANVTSIGLIPEANVAMIDDAALLQHPMMLNFFACTSFRVTDAANVEAVTAALDGAIKENNWMCGQPEGYFIVTVGNVVVSVYGLNDNISAMKDALTATYENAVVAYEGSFAV